MTESNKKVTINIKNKVLHLKLGPAISKPEIRPPENTSNTTEHCMNCSESASSLFNMRSIIVPHNHLAVKFVECFEFCTGKQVDEEIANPKVCLKCWQQIKADFNAKVEKAATPTPSVSEDNKSNVVKKVNKISQDSTPVPKTKEEDGMAEIDPEQSDSSVVSEEIEEVPVPKSISEPELVMVQAISGDSEGESNNIFTEGLDNSEVEIDVNASVERTTEKSETTDEENSPESAAPKHQKSSNENSNVKRVPPKRKRGSSFHESLSAGSEDDHAANASDISEDPIAIAASEDSKDEDYTISEEDEIPEPKMRASRRHLKKPKRYIENSDDPEVETEELKMLSSSKDSSVNKDLSESSESEKDSEDSDLKPKTRAKRKLLQTRTTAYEEQPRSKRRAASKRKVSMEETVSEVSEDEVTEVTDASEPEPSDVVVEVNEKIDKAPETPAPIERYTKNGQKISVFDDPTGSETSYYRCTVCPKKRFIAYSFMKSHFHSKAHLRKTASIADDEKKDLVVVEKKRNFQYLTPSEEQRLLAAEERRCRDMFVKTSFDCRICSASFSLFATLVKHSKLSHSDINTALPSIYETEIQRFTNDDNELPSNAEESTIAYFKCKQCVDTKFVDYITVKSHISKLHCPKQIEIPLYCKICDLTFDKKVQHTLHMKKGQHEKKEEEQEQFNPLHDQDTNVTTQIECKLCSNQFRRRNHLVQHYQLLHKGVDPSLPTIFEENLQKYLHPKTGQVAFYKCKQCESSEFTYYFQYKQHVSRKHRSEDKNKTIANLHDKHIKNEYECKICKSTGINLKMLSQHWREKHKKIDPMLPTESELNMQLFTKDGVQLVEQSDDLATLDVGYFMCKKCKILKFPDYTAYKSHIVMFHVFHLKESYTCDLCYATFTTPKEFANHHSDNLHLEASPAAGVGEFVCDYCGIFFWTQKILKDHKARRHSSIPLNVPHEQDNLHDINVTTRIECKLCSSFFNRKSQLIVHYELAHKGVDPSLSTIFEENMLKYFHLKTSVVRFYKCEQCKLTKFYQYSHYKDHVTLMHLTHVKNDTIAESVALPKIVNFNDLHDKHIKNMYECKICKSSAINLKMLLQHWKGKHEDIDSTLPTESELNMQLFKKNGAEIVERSYDLATLDVGYFMCKKCKILKFTDYTAYKSHIVMFHVFHLKESYTCDKCYATFTTLKEVSNHYSNNLHLEAPAAGVGEFECVHCGILFWTPKILQDHIYRKHSAAPILRWRDKYVKSVFECRICTEQFLTMFGLFKHSEKIHKDINPRLPTITEINIQIFTNDDEEILDKAVHPLTGLSDLDEAKISYYKCKQCEDVRFTNYQDYKIHFKSAHYAQSFMASVLQQQQCRDKYVSNRLECKHCLVYFGLDQYDSLVEHANNAHKAINPILPTKFELNIQLFDDNDTEILDDIDCNAVTYFKCKKCKKLKFVDYHQFKQHFVDVHCAQKDKAQTEIIRLRELAAALQKEGNLWRDKYVSIGYECKMCLSSYKLLNPLLKHCETLHKDVDPQLPTIFEANIQLFNENSTEIVVTSNDAPTQKVSFYMCKQCINLRFVDYNRYKSHIVAKHQRQLKKDYTCYKCCASFTSGYELEAHNREDKHLPHSIDSPNTIEEKWRDKHVKDKIECKLCKCSYTFMENFHSHIQNEHKDVDPKDPTVLDRAIKMVGTGFKEIFELSNAQRIAFYMCKQCPNLKFVRYCIFKDHVLQGHVPDPECLTNTAIDIWKDKNVPSGFECRFCKTIYNSKAFFASHCAKKHKDINPSLPSIFELNIQKFATDDKEIFDSTNTADVAYYKCKQCKKAKFFGYHFFKSHVFIVHQMNQVAAVFTCDVCCATYTIEKDLTLHTNKFHSTTMTLRQALQVQTNLRWCDKYIDYLPRADSHKILFVCKLCENSYSHYKNLEKHCLALHRGIDPALPTVIDQNIQMFSRGGILMLIGSNCDTSKGAYFKCKQCANEQFYSYRSFKQHFSKVHKEQLSNLPMSKHDRSVQIWRDQYAFGFECKICLHSSRNMVQLIRHCKTAHKDVDPTTPTIFKLNLRMFAQDDSELLESSDDLSVKKVAYYKCIQCVTVRFTNYRQYKSHVSFVHYLGKTGMMFNCNVPSCGASFSTKALLSDHLSYNYHLKPISKPMVIETAAFDGGSKCEPELQIDDIDGVHEAEIKTELYEDVTFEITFIEDFKVTNTSSATETQELLHETDGIPLNVCSTSDDKIVGKAQYFEYNNASNDYRIKCEYCPVSLISLEDLANHKLACHEGSPLTDSHIVCSE